MKSLIKKSGFRCKRGIFYLLLGIVGKIQHGQSQDKHNNVLEACIHECIGSRCVRKPVRIHVHETWHEKSVKRRANLDPQSHAGGSKCSISRRFCCKRLLD